MPAVRNSKKQALKYNYIVKGTFPLVFLNRNQPVLMLWQFCISRHWADERFILRVQLVGQQRVSVNLDGDVVWDQGHLFLNALNKTLSIAVLRPQRQRSINTQESEGNQ